MKTQLIETPYGRKTPELLVAAMDCYTMHQNNPVYSAAPDLFEACQAAFENLDPLYPENHTVMVKLRAALAKAKGEL